MKFNGFRNRLEELAWKNENNQHQIQALITKYYKYKVIPRFVSIQKFVVRCSSNKHGEIFRNIARCSYNPNSETIPLQSCNYPKQQVF